MRLRYALFCIFAALTTIPVIIFWFWSQSLIVQSEFDEVKDRHLLLARNLGAALQRYHSDVSAVFDQVARRMMRGNEVGEVDELFRRMGLQHICLVDTASGTVLSAVNTPATVCPEEFAKPLVYALQAFSTSRAKFSTVMKGRHGKPVIYVVCKKGDRLVIGSLATDYFIELGKAIAFGVKGHAAIVDQSGNVLAHPLDSWISQRKNISAVTAVKRMMAGETGIQQFYSPALKGDMIAGFTSVPGPGWGVMIPQPIEELHSKATRVQHSVFGILSLCLLFVCVLSMITAYYLSRPLEQIVEATNQSKSAGALKEIELSHRWAMPYELHRVLRSFNRMVRRLRQNMASIKTLAYSDVITGLPNRVAFEKMVTEEIRRLGRAESPGVMIYVDLDDFKDINDTLGHECGDEVLKTLAAELIEALHAVTRRAPIASSLNEKLQFCQLEGASILARLGGDEFAIFVPGIASHNQMVTLLSQIKGCFSQPLHVCGETFAVGASVGMARYPTDADSYKGLLKLADIAMYEAKNSGKNKAQIYSLEIGTTTVAEVRREVSAAIRTDELALFYQPKINCRSGEVDSVEALVRWRHPVRGPLSPGSFIPMIERSNVAIELGEWAVRTAAKDMVFWQRHGIETNVAVNIAGRHFCSSDFVERMRKIVAESDVDATRLEFEITEEAIISDLTNAKKALVRLKEAGIRVSLDDFGRGYSNLSRLIELPVGAIKVDGPLTAGLGSDPRVGVIVKAAIDMAKGLGCDTVAEGVETAEQAAAMTRLGCTHLQGFHFAKPMNRDMIHTWIMSANTGKARAMQDGLKKHYSVGV